MARKYRIVRLLPLGAGELVVAADVVFFEGGKILVGGSATHDTRTKSMGCLWDESGKPRTLEDVAGYARGQVMEIVSPGRFVGHCFDHIASDKRFGAVIWGPDGVEELPALDGHDSATTRCGNIHGVVAGQSFQSDIIASPSAVNPLFFK